MEKEKKMITWGYPDKFGKKGIRGRLKCSDFDGTTTIRRQIRCSFSIACYTASKPTGNGQYSVYWVYLGFVQGDSILFVEYEKNIEEIIVRHIFL